MSQFFPSQFRMKAALQWCSGSRPVFYLLVYFMALIIVGTAAQKYMGLFPATHMFFNSFVFWFGFMPLPGGATILLLLFCNLFLHFIQKSRWDVPHLGTTLAHLSVLVLLLGGAITLADKQEGFMILQPNTIHNASYDYHQRHLAIQRNNETLWQKPHQELRPKEIVTADGLRLTIQSICRNCTLDEKNRLQKLATQNDDEMNQMAVTLATPDGHSFILAEFLNPMATITLDKAEYTVRFERRSFDLPFSLSLQNLTQSFYPGTSVARDYASSIVIIEKEYRWPVEIAMNKPFRYKGYTFYQSSVLQLPDDTSASVLNVVKNSGWFFPYIASALLFIGLGLHAWMRRHGRV